MFHILIVDDDVALTEMTSEFLHLEGFAVEAVHNGAACLRNVQGKDLIVLDVMLPGISGFEVLKQLRQISNVPVIMLTARDSDVDKVVGLEIGADDFVSKPVSPRELVARIRAVLRRTTTRTVAVTDDIVIGDVRLNPSSRSAEASGQPLDLTTAEFNLLEYLLIHAGQVITRESLSTASFGRQNSDTIDRNVDTLVSKVRRKLGRGDDVERFIKTVRNAGYLFVIPPQPNLHSNATARAARS